MLDVTWEYGREAVYELFAVQHEVKHKEIVCMIDEAHLLSRDTLEELRFFLNTDMSSSTPAFLMLSGQSELLSRLRRQEMVMKLSERLAAVLRVRCSTATQELLTPRSATESVWNRWGNAERPHAMTMRRWNR